MAQPIGTSGITPASKPAPLPKGPGFLGNLGQSVGNVARGAQQTIRNVAPPPHGGSDIQSSGPGYGGAVASAYKQSPQYKGAILDVFRAQAPHQQKAIVQGALRNRTPEGDAVLNYIRQVGTRPGGNLAAIAPTITPGVLSDVLKATGGKGISLLENAAKDIWNLPGATVQGLYALGKYALTGEKTNGRNGFQMLADPYIQLVEHPGKTLSQHPVNSLLMLGGAESALGRGAGFAARTGAVGDRAAALASTVRPDLHIGKVAGEASPVTEARSFSPDILKKSFQVAHDRIVRAQGRDPNVVQPSRVPAAAAYAMNRGIQAKLHRGVDEMTAVHQMEHRSERAQAIKSLQQLQPTKVARNVVGHVLQGVLRTPDTAKADALAEIDRLRQAQSRGLLQRRSVGLTWNRSQIRDLQRAHDTPGALDEAFKVAEKVRPVLHTQDAYLTAHALLEPDQALRSRLFPYAIAHMGAKPGSAIRAQFEGDQPIGAGLERGDGSRITTQEILDHVKANGVPDPAYVGHFPGKVAPYRFYSAYKMARGLVGDKTRTGRAFESGAYDHTWNGLIGQVASRAQAVSKASLHDRVISRYGITIPKPLLQKMGIKSPNGDFTPNEARAIARAAMVDDHGNRIPNALELVPVSRASAGVLDQVRNLQHPRELNNISQLELRALAHAVETTAQRTDGTRNVVLVPKDVVSRFGDQYAKTESLLKGVGRVTQQFRRTVLPYSTHWMLQIGSEAALRAALGGVLHPRALAEGRQLAHHLEGTRAGRAVLAETVSSTMYNGGGSGIVDALKGQAGRGALDIHNPNAGVIATAAKTFPVSRVIIAAHNRYADTITAAMYSLEHNARIMGLGQLAHKEVQSFGFSWRNAVKVQGQDLANLATQLKSDPALVAKFGREIDNIFGKYNKFTPKQRAMIQSFTPFLPWYLNAAKYVLWHLPAHHPVSSALLASLRQTVNQDIQDGKTMPLNAYAMQELARISPFGIFTPPSTKPSTGAALAGQQFTGAVLPQVEGAFYNLAGVNSFGAGALKGPGGDVKPKSGPAAAAMAEGLLESMIPLFRYARMAREGGKPAYGTSTIVSPQTKAEPGTSLLNRLLNPFYSFERAQQSGGPTAKGGGATSLLNSIGSGASGVDLKQSLGDGVSEADLARSLQP